MSLCEENFLEFLRPLQYRLSEKNHAVRRNYGHYSNWSWNPDEATLTFTEPGQSDLHIDVTLVGTTVGNPGNGAGPTPTSVSDSAATWSR